MRALLTDIEGTTSSIHFVHQVLFPYSAKAMPAFLRASENEGAVRQLIMAIEQECQISGLEAVNQQLQQWITSDLKHPALKALQGMIWQRGYQQMEYRAHVYEDVAPCLQTLHARGVLLYVYSSGSIAAQKLFFGHSVAGDLRPLFRDYFDTSSGHKRASESYQSIARSMGLLPGEILFASDIEAELDAARSAGMGAVQLVREGTTASARHATISSFSELNDSWFRARLTR
jgi:enolase-phosphatase E1